MAVGNVHEMFGEEQVCSSEDMIADGLTQTRSSQYMPRSPIGGGVN